MTEMNPRLKDFILFCVERKGTAWPALYDEMARVAGQRLYQGMSYTELRRLGLCLGLDGVERTIQLVKQATGAQ